MPIESTAESIATRFWDLVDRSAGPTSCWPFRGSLTSKRYGRFTIGGRGGKVVRAHRLAYWLANSEWPEPCACHRCDNPPCCNPAHIYAGSNDENVSDRIQRGNNAKGTTVGASKLIDDDVRSIRAAYAAGGTSLRRLANEYNIHGKTVYSIVHRRTWKHVI